MPSVLAIAAHPDDVEFLMAGALILLRERGWEAHVLHLADGRCGTAGASVEEIVARRAAEARAACALIGAHYYPAIAADLQLQHDPATVARVVAVIREVGPAIVLLHSPADYMEDHQNAARIGSTAAFARTMSNYPGDPPRPPIAGDVTVYHAMPHGLRDPMRRLVRPGLYLDLGRAIAKKREMLACHRSQQEWLDRSQGLSSCLDAMTDMARELGRMSGVFEYAEGFRRRNHLGLSAREQDPLAQELGRECLVDRGYEDDLEK